MEGKTLGKVWYYVGEYGGFAGMIYSLFNGDNNLFAVSAIATIYGTQGLRYMETKELDKRVSGLESKLKE